MASVSEMLAAASRWCGRASFPLRNAHGRARMSFEASRQRALESVEFQNDYYIDAALAKLYGVALYTMHAIIANLHYSGFQPAIQINDSLAKLVQGCANLQLNDGDVFLPDREVWATELVAEQILRLSDLGVPGLVDLGSTVGFLGGRVYQLLDRTSSLADVPGLPDGGTSEPLRPDLVIMPSGTDGFGDPWE